MTKAKLEVTPVARPLRSVFKISRGTKTEAVTIRLTIHQDGAMGRGECVPYARYGESIDSVTAQIEAMRPAIEAGFESPENGRLVLGAKMPSGAARNALDCALWDLEAKITGQSVRSLAKLPDLQPVLTAFTLSVDSPEKMAEAASAAAERPLLKLKAAGQGDLERVAAVRKAAPNSRLIVDANEAWEPGDVVDRLAALADLGVEMVEQPLPAGQDSLLADITPPMILCADESFHDRSSLDDVCGLYGMVNIKLDKTGGLTEALAAIKAARARDLKIMVGCMVSGSLAMAPAFLAAQGAEIVDLDGPLLLAEDEDIPLIYHGSLIDPPPGGLWG